MISLSEAVFVGFVDPEVQKRRREERRQIETAIAARLYPLLKEHPADHEGLVLVRDLLCQLDHEDVPESLTPLEVLGFKTARTYNMLMREGIKCVELLVTMTEADLLDIRQFGEGSLDEVKTLLAQHQHGLELKKA